MKRDSEIRLSSACSYPQRRDRDGAIALPSTQDKDLGWERERRL